MTSKNCRHESRYRQTVTPSSLLARVTIVTRGANLGQIKSFPLSAELISMATPIHRLAGHSAKRLCLRKTPFIQSRPSMRSLSAYLPRRYAVPYEPTKLIPTNEDFVHPTN